MDAFWSAPPVSRTLTALTFVQSALVYGGLLSGYRIIFSLDSILKFPPELWRLATPFFLTGPQLNFLFDLYFIYTYASALETGSPRFILPGDFFVYVLFVGTVIMVSSSIRYASSATKAHAMSSHYTFEVDKKRNKEFASPIYVNPRSCTNSTKLTAGCLLGRLIFTSALILAFIYTWAQDNRGRKVMFFVIQIPAEWLPFAMLAVTLVMHGWGSVMSQGTGILAAHLYDFLTRIYPTFGGGRNYITTPAFIQRIFDGHRATSRTYGTAYRPGQQSTQGSSSGWSSSFGSSWSSRGPGRRLGGD
ncbi:Centromere/microtubule-binding protein Cbf5 [Rasamsonia emersonii CBS 393.64]|uniref:Derlin n=1 Tax=Rasamsonia emersonii (strain ATCC 16479 / CBS 393.64 / IMI 116815) TaxID=1408163 RepID=A0A0F4YW44_RASE3|nr:Centromere/microtubule-binding protein Cbf5 [Rasamsonia emersonii CBS 393.64]KKA21843.1 Centromere/microtubule-binding protein Cbf5 [Rasamsonia emersonii CBS 393.64]